MLLKENSVWLREKPVAVCSAGMVSVPGSSVAGGVVSSTVPVSLGSGLTLSVWAGALFSPGPPTFPLETRGMMMVITMITAAMIRPREITRVMMLRGEGPRP